MASVNKLLSSLAQENLRYMQNVLLTKFYVQSVEQAISLQALHALLRIFNQLHTGMVSS